MWLALGDTAVGDVDALGGGVAYVCRATRGRGLDDVTARLQFLLPLIQNSESDALKHYCEIVVMAKVVRGQL